jgi:hypothetical protein
MYQAKIHEGVFPCQLKQDDKHIFIQSDGRVAIQANATLKRKKLNTPTKRLPEKDPDISEEKLIHNIIPCKEKLFTWKLTADNKCNACGVLEDYQHFFIECTIVQPFLK